MSPLGPKKPKGKPRPKPIKFVNDEFGWIDGEQSFDEGVQIYVCTDEDLPMFDLLETGTYTLDTGVLVEVENGIITQIG